jgi:predicted RNA-binding Zn ribbon-like protein
LEELALHVKTTTELGPDWRDGFIFLGNQLALDFLNTRPVQNDEALELLPNFEALLRWFGAAGVLTSRNAAAMRQRWGKSARARRTLENVLCLREKMRKEVLAWEAGATVHGATIDELNRLMAEHPARAKVTTRGGALSKELWFPMEEPENLLGPLANGAATLFTEVDRDGVRKCGQCVLHFLDTSKKGTRRWCSMRLCGNRLKVAAYAARRRTP